MYFQITTRTLGGKELYKSAQKNNVIFFFHENVINAYFPHPLKHYFPNIYTPKLILKMDLKEKYLFRP